MTRALIVLMAAPVLASVHAHGAAWRHVSDELPSPEVQFVERDGDAVWVGTLGGLAVFRKGADTPVTVASGEAVWDIQPMAEGRHWVGTAMGILSLADGETTQRLADASVGRLARFGEDGCLAIADRNGVPLLMQVKDDKWAPVPRFIRNAVEDLFVTSDGVVWVMLDANGIVAADPVAAPESWVHHLQGVNLRSFCQDSRGRIWCGTWGRGVMVMEDGAWRGELGQEKSVITMIAEDGDGHIWAATNANGLWQFDGERWTNHLRQEGSINVLQAAGGRVYISSQAVPALRVWAGKDWRVLVDAPAMFRSVIQGPDGKVWAGNTLMGLYVEP